MTGPGITEIEQVVPTQDWQVVIRGLLLGPDTPYELTVFNPYERSVRATSGPRPHRRGSWAGREEAEQATIPLEVSVISGAAEAGWLALHQALDAALTPSSTDVELQWQLGGERFLMGVRPRALRPSIEQAMFGHGKASVVLVAPDPRIYSAVEHELPLTLASTTGGLTLPYTLPYTIDAVTTSGRGEVTNAGTQDTTLRVRIDANGTPLQQPRWSLITADGRVWTQQAQLTLDAGQYLEIDTEREQAWINGTTSRTGLISGAWPLLPTGTHEIAFDAAVYTAAASMAVRWRDAW